MVMVDVFSTPRAPAKDFVEFVRKTTRSCQFDFNQVAERVNASTQGREGLNTPVSADICRQIYAQDYSLIVQSKRAECDEAANSSTTTDLSVQEILLQQELRQLENDKKIEKIFDRVLTTLETAESVALDEDDEIVLARQRYKENKEYEKYKKQQAEELQREQLLLEEQRVALSKRFDADSEDAKGIDPFAVNDRVADSVSHEIDVLETHPAFSDEVMSSFDMESLLNTPEFDVLLSQIEQDIGAKEESMAMGKDVGEENGDVSELSEVLRFLAKSAEEKFSRPAAPSFPLPSLVQIARPPEPPSRPESRTGAEAKVQRERISGCQSGGGGRSGGGNGRSGSGGRSGGRGRGYGGDAGREIGDVAARESGSDDEDDWEGLRRKIKQSGGSSDDRGDTIRSVNDFWGAYGNSWAVGPVRGAQAMDKIHERQEDVCEPSDQTDSDPAEEIDDNAKRDVASGADNIEKIAVVTPPECDDAVHTSLSSQYRENGDERNGSSAGEEESLSPPVPPVSSPSVEPASSQRGPSPCNTEVDPVVVVTDTGGGVPSARSGGILGEGGGGGRSSRAKRGKRLKGSVEVALRRREGLNISAAPTVPPRLTEEANLADVRELVVEVAPVTAEEDVVKSEPLPTNILVPSSHPLCPALPPRMHDIIRDPIHLQSGKAVKECQNSVVLSFDLSCSNSAARGAGHSICTAQSDGSDSIIYMILAWVSTQLDVWEATVIAVHLSASQRPAVVDVPSSSAGQVALIVVLEGSNPHSAMFLSKAVMQAMQSTTIAAVLFAFELQQDFSGDRFLSVPARTGPLSAIGSVVPPDQAIHILHQVSQASPAAAYGKDWQGRLTQNAVVTCVLKPYLLQDGKVLATVFSMCEKAGLRLCGLRTAYVSRSAGPSLCKMVHPDILCPPRGMSVSSSSDRDGAGCVLVALFYSSRFVAAETLRNLLGPDDPSLAKRTDPASIRAVCGASNIANVCYPLSSLLINCWRDTLFWFGPRDACASSDLLTIVIPPLRYAVMGISIEPVFSLESGSLDLSKMNRAANMMASLQRLCLQCMQSATSTSMHFVTMWSCNREEQGRYGLQVCGEADYVHGPSCYLTAVFVTHVGDLHVETTNASIQKRVSQISSLAKDLFTVRMSLKVKDRFRRHEHLRPLGSNAQVFSSRSFSDEDFDSHEDVGLQDVLVCSFSTHRNILDGVYALNPQELALHVLQALPPACHATILGISTPNWNAPSNKTPFECDSLCAGFASDKLDICLRGLHLIENISYAIRIGTDVANGIATSASGMLMTAGNVRIKSVSVPSVDDVRVLKGRRALDTICREFLIDKESSFISQFAATSLHAYVPSWAIDREHSHAGHRAGADADMKVLRSLFCPGSFSALSVVVVPYPWRDKGASKVGVFFRVLKKLEKEAFDVKHISTSVMSSDMADLCANDIIEDGEDDLYTESTNTTVLKERFALLVGKPVLAIVVQGNSALRRLRCIIGPVDGEDAMENYPTSIMANLTSFVQPESRSVDGLAPPSTFFSRTCRSTEKYMKAFCKFDTIGAFELSLCPALSSAANADCETAVNSSPGSPPAKGVGDVDGHAVEREAILRTLRDQCLQDQQTRDKVQTAVSAESLEDVGASALDVTCIVLTSILTNLIGVSPILHAVNKEGIKVVNARTSVLHPMVARKLADLAGQSSLSMKPTNAALLGGPVLFLALEGASHSILRLKSILQQSSSGSVYSHSNMLNLRSDSRAANALGKLPDGSWGLLASSSSRLAHNLLLYSFNRLYSSTCSIIPQEGAQDACAQGKGQSPPHYTSPTTSNCPAVDKEDPEHL